MVRPRVAVTGPADVDGRAREAERGSLALLLRVEVVDAARDRNARGVEQAGVDLIVDGELKEFAERVAVHAAGVERRLAEVRAAAQVVVVSREDVERAEGRLAAARILEIELRRATATEKSQNRHRAHNTN